MFSRVYCLFKYLLKTNARKFDLLFWIIVFRFTASAVFDFYIWQSFTGRRMQMILYVLHAVLDSRLISVSFLMNLKNKSGSISALSAEICSWFAGGVHGRENLGKKHLEVLLRSDEMNQECEAVILYVFFFPLTMSAVIQTAPRRVFIWITLIDTSTK